MNAKLDLYDGTGLRNINELGVWDDFGLFVISIGNRTALGVPLGVPTLFLEARACKRCADVMKRQDCYDSSPGACAVHWLRSYKQDGPMYDESPYAITSTYNAGTGTLRIYATHLSQSTDCTLEYNMI